MKAQTITVIQIPITICSQPQGKDNKELKTINEDLDAITSLLYQIFEIPSFKRDYDTVFGKISDILSRYGVIENSRNLSFRFTLFMQEFFESIPQDQWKIKDPAFIKQSEVFAIQSLKNG